MASQITASKYCTFLNAVAASDPHHLYDERMESDLAGACVTRAGAPGNFFYQVIEGKAETPITFLSYENASLYCNWLSNNAAKDSSSTSTFNFDCSAGSTDQQLKSNQLYFNIINTAASNLAQQSSGDESTSWLEKLAELAAGVGMIFGGGENNIVRAPMSDGVRESADNNRPALQDKPSANSEPIEEDELPALIEALLNEQQSSSQFSSLPSRGQGCSSSSQSSCFARTGEEKLIEEEAGQLPTSSAAKELSASVIPAEAGTQDTVVTDFSVNKIATPIETAERPAKQPARFSFVSLIKSFFTYCLLLHVSEFVTKSASYTSYAARDLTTTFASPKLLGLTAFLAILPRAEAARKSAFAVYNGLSTDQIYPQSITANVDGSYNIGGYVLPGAGQNSLLIKLNASGQKEWFNEQRFSLSPHYSQIFNTAVMDGLLYGGGRVVYGGNSVPFISKNNLTTGALLSAWALTGLSGSSQINTILATANQTLICFGSNGSPSVGFGLEFNPTSKVVLSASSISAGGIQSAAAMSDNSYVIGGSTSSNKCWLSKISHNSLSTVWQSIWMRLYSGTTGGLGSLAVQNNTVIFASGISNSNWDGVLGSVNGKTGAINWITSIGGTSNDQLNGVAFKYNGLSNPNEIIAVGGTGSGTIGEAAWYVLMNLNNGTLHKSVILDGSGTDMAQRIISNNDGTFSSVGYTSSCGSSSQNLMFVTLDGNIGINTSILPSAIHYSDNSHNMITGHPVITSAVSSLTFGFPGLAATDITSSFSVVNDPISKFYSSPPTVMPTLTPTTPTAIPTDAIPTDQPTDEPTAKPTNPTGQPTRQPTGQPTSRPISTIANGLIADYPFNGNANDVSGNGNHGVVHSATPAPDRFGNANSAYSFDGLSSYIEVVDGSPFNFVNDMSLSVWVKPASSQIVANAAIFDKSSGPGEWIVRQYNGINSFSFKYFPGPYISVATQLISNAWNHLAITKQNTIINVYLNSVLAETGAGPNTITSNGNLPLVIGAGNGADTQPASNLIQHFNGLLDEIRIYNRTLSAHEIAELYDFQAPTGQPTGQPSRQPTGHPSSQPTSKPTNQARGKSAFAVYSGNGNQFISPQSITGNADGSYIMGGYVSPVSGGSKSLLGKFNTNGIKEWVNEQTSSLYSQIEILSTAVMDDALYGGGMAYSISTGVFPFFTKNSLANGTLLSSWGITNVITNTYITTILAEANHTLACFGYNNAAQSVVFKFHPDQGMVSSAKYITSPAGGGYITSATATSDGSYLVGGYLDGYYNTGWLSKINYDGAAWKNIWTRLYSTSSDSVNINSVTERNGVVAIAGSVGVGSGNIDGLIGSINGTTGEKNWFTSIDETSDDNLNGVVFKRDRSLNNANEIMAVGSTGSASWYALMNLNNGTLRNSIILTCGEDNALNVVANNDGTFTSLGTTAYGAGPLYGSTVMLTMLDGSGEIDPLILPSGISYSNNLHSITTGGHVITSTPSSLTFSPLTLTVTNIKSALSEVVDPITAAWERIATSHPTGQPSSQPTSQPSNPTGQPTDQPSGQPASRPTGQPSTHPTDQPSNQPASHPTDQPTGQPTDQPTDQPTGQPTDQPTKQPTDQPVSHPTGQPSTQPTDQPSAQPASHPTGQPTDQPTDQPSSHPTDQPTDKPSGQPVSHPTNHPTGQPTGQPVNKPTGQPTDHPTDQPTDRPSDQPSDQPTGQPSGQPASHPTGQPTDQPTDQPSNQPTRQPTGQPASHPTDKPTDQPSGQPASHPTDQPTDQPTGQPTVDPTQSTKAPTLTPTTAPTTGPTTSPTATSTTAPTTPTIRPSRNPSRAPTIKPPTLTPTKTPVLASTTEPTTTPTTEPSTAPTAASTTTPTTAPTAALTRPPTQSPTATSSTAPTAPSARPSRVPSRTPTLAKPSNKPSSALPTSRLTGAPSTLPTAEPSNMPTVEPTLAGRHSAFDIFSALKNGTLHFPSMAANADGSYTLGGYANSSSAKNSFNSLLGKLHANGTKAWFNEQTSSLYSQIELFSTAMMNGRLYAGGSAHAVSTGMLPYISKNDASNGTLLSAWVFSGLGSNPMMALFPTIQQTLMCFSRNNGSVGSVFEFSPDQAKVLASHSISLPGLLSSVAQTSDHAFLMGGTAFSSSNNQGWLSKISSTTWKPLWTRLFAGGANGNVQINAVAERNGTAIFAGSINGDGLLGSLNTTTGKTHWMTSLGGTSDDSFNGVTFSLNNANELMAAGSTSSGTIGGTQAAWYSLMHLGDGSLHRSAVLDGAGDEIAQHVVANNDGTFSSLGTTTSFGNGASKVMFAKLDQNGEIDSSILPSVISYSDNSHNIIVGAQTITSTASSLAASSLGTRNRLRTKSAFSPLALTVENIASMLAAVSDPIVSVWERAATSQPTFSPSLRPTPSLTESPSAAPFEKTKQRTSSNKTYYVAGGASAGALVGAALFYKAFRKAVAYFRERPFHTIAPNELTAAEDHMEHSLPHVLPHQVAPDALSLSAHGANENELRLPEVTDWTADMLQSHNHLMTRQESIDSLSDGEINKLEDLSSSDDESVVIRAAIPSFERGSN